MSRLLERRGKIEKAEMQSFVVLCVAAIGPSVDLTFDKLQEQFVFHLLDSRDDATVQHHFSIMTVAKVERLTGARDGAVLVAHVRAISRE